MCILQCDCESDPSNRHATLEAALKDEGVDVKKLKWDVVADPGTTGNFEVKVNGNLLHSKKTKSQGFLESNDSTFGLVAETVLKELGQ
eukprot:g13558.t1